MKIRKKLGSVFKKIETEAEMFQLAVNEQSTKCMVMGQAEITKRDIPIYNKILLKLEEIARQIPKREKQKKSLTKVEK